MVDARLLPKDPRSKRGQNRATTEAETGVQAVTPKNVGTCSLSQLVSIIVKNVEPVITIHRANNETPTLFAAEVPTNR